MQLYRRRGFGTIWDDILADLEGEAAIQRGLQEAAETGEAATAVTQQVAETAAAEAWGGYESAAAKSQVVGAVSEGVQQGVNQVTTTSAATNFSTYIPFIAAGGLILLAVGGFVWAVGRS